MQTCSFVYACLLLEVLTLLSSAAHAHDASCTSGANQAIEPLCPLISDVADASGNAFALPAGEVTSLSTSIHSDCLALVVDASTGEWWDGALGQAGVLNVYLGGRVGQAAFSAAELTPAGLAECLDQGAFTRPGRPHFDLLAGTDRFSASTSVLSLVAAQLNVGEDRQADMLYTSPAGVFVRAGLGQSYQGQLMGVQTIPLPRPSLGQLSNPVFAQGDLNSDGFADVLSVVGTQAVWYRSFGNGRLSATRNFMCQLTHGDVGPILFTDVYGRGANFSDLVYGSMTSSHVVIVRAINGTGAYACSSPTSIHAGDSGVVDLVAFDHNTDNFTDFLVLTIGSFPGYHYYFTACGPACFGLLSRTLVRDQVRDSAGAADLWGIGRRSLFGVGSDGIAVGYFPGSSTTFPANVGFDTCSGCKRPTAGDFDGDGMLDILTGPNTEMQILFGRSVFSAPNLQNGNRIGYPAVFFGSKIMKAMDGDGDGCDEPMQMTSDGSNLVRQFLMLDSRGARVLPRAFTHLPGLYNRPNPAGPAADNRAFGTYSTAVAPLRGPTGADSFVGVLAGNLSQFWVFEQIGAENDPSTGAGGFPSFETAMPLLANGSGTFSNAIAADCDGDGADDVVLVAPRPALGPAAGSLVWVRNLQVPGASGIGVGTSKLAFDTAAPRQVASLLGIQGATGAAAVPWEVAALVRNGGGGVHLVATDPPLGAVLLFVNTDGSGNAFSAPGVTLATGLQAPAGLTVARIDDDALLDLALVAGAPGVRIVVLLFGRRLEGDLSGAPSFAPALLAGALLRPSTAFLAPGDFVPLSLAVGSLNPDADSWPDIVIGLPRAVCICLRMRPFNASSPTVNLTSAAAAAVAAGAGAGQFDARELRAWSTCRPTRLAPSAAASDPYVVPPPQLVDWNGDQLLDVAWRRPGHVAPQIVLGMPAHFSYVDWSRGERLDASHVSGNTRALAFGHVDGDATLDLAWLDFNNQLDEPVGAASALKLAYDVAGARQAPTSLALPVPCQALALVDMDADGNVDAVLLAARWSASNVSIWWFRNTLREKAMVGGALGAEPASLLITLALQSDGAVSTTGSASSEPAVLSCPDLNDDGIPDVLLAFATGLWARLGPFAGTGDVAVAQSIASASSACDDGMVVGRAGFVLGHFDGHDRLIDIALACEPVFATGVQEARIVLILRPKDKPALSGFSRRALARLPANTTGVSLSVGMLERRADSASTDVDLVVFLDAAPGVVLFLLGRADLSAGPSTQLAVLPAIVLDVGSGVSAGALGELSIEHDGLADIVVSAKLAGLLVFKNTGGGNFSLATVSPLQVPPNRANLTALYVDVFSRDGLPGILALDSGAQSASLLAPFTFWLPTIPLPYAQLAKGAGAPPLVTVDVGACGFTLSCLHAAVLKVASVSLASCDSNNATNSLLSTLLYSAASGAGSTSSTSTSNSADDEVAHEAQLHGRRLPAVAKVALPAGVFQGCFRYAPYELPAGAVLHLSGAGAERTILRCFPRSHAALSANSEPGQYLYLVSGGARLIVSNLTIEGSFSGAGSNSAALLSGAALRVSGDGSVLELHGVTIRGGAARAHASNAETKSTDSASPPSGYGGAVLVLDGAQLDAFDSIFEYNVADKSGGAIAFLHDTALSSGGAPCAVPSVSRLVRCTFRSNTALAGGGALFIETARQTSVQLDACSFAHNDAMGIPTDVSKSAIGGALFALAARTAQLELRCAGCSFASNHAWSAGGALAIRVVEFGHASVSLTDGLFLNNVATLGGGALYGENAGRGILDLNGTRLVLERNSVSNGNGAGISLQTSAIHDRALRVRLEQVRLSDNTAGRHGGGLALLASLPSAAMPLEVELGASVHLIGNSAVLGGAASLFGRAVLRATNGTEFLENSARVAGHAYFGGPAALAALELSTLATFALLDERLSSTPPCESVGLFEAQAPVIRFAARKAGLGGGNGGFAAMLGSWVIVRGPIQLLTDDDVSERSSRVAGGGLFFDCTSANLLLTNGILHCAATNAAQAFGADPAVPELFSAAWIRMDNASRASLMLWRELLTRMTDYGPLIASRPANMTWLQTPPSKAESGQLWSKLGGAVVRLVDSFGQDVVDRAAAVILEVVSPSAELYGIAGEARVALSHPKLVLNATGLAARVGARPASRSPAGEGRASRASSSPAGIAVTFQLGVEGYANIRGLEWTLEVLLCAPGRGVSVSEGTDLLVCSDCPVQTFSSTYTLDVCSACPNQIVPTEGARECVRCEDHAEPLTGVRFDAISGETIWPNCSCVPGYYSPGRAYNTQCEVCPNGGVCMGGLEKPWPLPGYYDISAASDGTAFAACQRPGACVGGRHPCSAATEGFMCAECRAKHYTGSSGQCVRCPDAALLMFLLLLALVLVIAAAEALFIYVSMRVNFRAGELKQARVRPHRFPRTLVQGLLYLQIVSVIGTADLGWSATARKFFAAADVVNFDLRFFAAECTISSFWSQYVLLLAMPLFFVLVALATIAALGSAQVPRNYRGAVLERLLVLLGLYAFVPLCSLTLQFFDCTKLPDGSFALDADLSRKCYSGTWLRVLPAALLALVLYVLGIPCLAVMRLWLVRRDLNANTTLFRLGALYDVYRRMYFFVEPAMLVKRGLAVCVVLFASKNKVLLLAGLSVIFGFSLVCQAKFMPYFLSIHNQTELALNCFLAMVLAVGAVSFADRFPNAALRALADTVFSLVFLGSLLFIIAAVFVELRTIVIARRAAAAKRDNRPAVAGGNFDAGAINGSSGLDSAEMSLADFEPPARFFAWRLQQARTEAYMEVGEERATQIAAATFDIGDKALASSTPIISSNASASSGADAYVDMDTTY